MRLAKFTWANKIINLQAIRSASEFSSRKSILHMLHKYAYTVEAIPVELETYAVLRDEKV